MFQFTGFLLLSLFHCYSEIKISVTNHNTHHCLFIELVLPKTLVWPCNMGPPKFGLGPLIFLRLQPVTPIFQNLCKTLQDKHSDKFHDNWTENVASRAYTSQKVGHRRLTTDTALSQ